jgi:hypothetical protein
MRTFYRCSTVRLSHSNFSLELIATIPPKPKDLRFATAFLVSLIYSSGECVAQYKYISEDPVRTQLNFVDDLQSNKLDTSNLDSQVVTEIQQRSQFAPNPDQLNNLGPVKQVCLLFGTKSNSKHTLAFRTVHPNGCGDWIVTIKDVPETIIAVGFKAKTPDPNKCGAPTFVPLPPQNNDTSFYIPLKMDCSDVSNLR